MAAAAFLAALPAHGAPSETEILIAAAGPLSGRYGDQGLSLVAGVTLAVEDINARGGLRLGSRRFRLRLRVFDDSCDSALAAKLARYIVEAGARLIVGHLCAGASIAAAKIYAGADIVEISPATRHPRFTDSRAGPAIFRLAGRNDRQGRAAGRYLAQAFAGKRIALVHDRTLAAMALLEGARSGIVQNGQKVSLAAIIRPGQNDYGRLIAKLKRARVDVVYIASYATEVGLITRQIAAAKLPVTVMSGEIITDKAFLEAAAGSANGTLVTGRPEPFGIAPAAKLIARLRAQHHPVTLTALAAYAAVETWKAAAEQSGSLQKSAVAASLTAGRFATVLGPLSFNAKGDADIPSYAIYRWRNGHLQQVLQRLPPRRKE